MSMLGAASGLAQSACMHACPLCSMVPIHEIPAHVHTGPSGLSSVGWCTIWVPTTHFLIDSKPIFHSGPTPGPPTHLCIPLHTFSAPSVHLRYTPAHPCTPFSRASHPYLTFY